MSGRRGSAAVGVLTIIDEEFTEVRNALDASENVSGTPYWRDPQQPERFVLRQMPDRANVPAGHATTRLIEHWRPEVVLVVGIAGGVAGKDPWLGDVVVPDYLHYGEFRKLVAGRDDARYFAYDQPTVSLREDFVDALRHRDDWLASLTAERPTEEDDPRKEGPRVWVSSLVAGEKVMGDPRHYEQQRVVASFPDAVAIDMESVGVARAVHEARRDSDYNPRLLVVRGISDFVEPAPARLKKKARRRAAEDNSQQRERWKTYAAASAAAFAAATVRAITS